MYNKIEEFIFEMIFTQNDDDFADKVDGLIESINRNVEDDELLEIIRLDINNILTNQNILEALIPPPKWISIGGSVAVSKWNQIVDELKQDFDYHKASTLWKDWEAQYHKKERLKADGKTPMETLVSERFKDDINNDSEKEYIYITNMDNDEKSVKGNKNIDFIFIDKKSETPMNYNSAYMFFDKNKDEYYRRSGKNLIYNVLFRLLKEEKAKPLSAKYLSKFTDKPDMVGMIVSEQYLQEAVKRYYHAIKTYRAKNTIFKGRKVRDIMESYNIIESLNLDFDNILESKSSFNFYSSILD